MTRMMILSIKFYPMVKGVEFARGTFEFVRPRRITTITYYPRAASLRRLLRVLAGGPMLDVSHAHLAPWVRRSLYGDVQ